MPKKKGNPAPKEALPFSAHRRKIKNGASLVTGQRVFVAMSGGVDSSVAAALLKKQGYEVVGVHIKCFNVDGCARQDAEDARQAAAHLGIPFYAFDFEKEYKDKVVEYMVDGYKKGITPNPDVMCNREVKFGLFLKKALELGADYIATGHYARLREVKSQKSKVKSYVLAVARDLNKDQSYFLWTLKPDQLQHCLFPIGKYTKPQVRKLAARFGLHNALKKDSQGICFLGQVSLPDFLKKYIKPKKGNVILAPSQKIIGTHNGAHLYTIGQRHGIMNHELRIKNKPNQKPFYVVSKNVKKNTIVVAEGENHPALYKEEVLLSHLNLLIPLGHSRSVPVLARVRYRQSLQSATLKLINSSTAKLKFNCPVKFVAPGQSAVFYNSKGIMLGGGIIE
jgi:tRNA-specific 2-thiouridylase